MTLAVSKALEDGAREAVCASTGNTSASAAAYCGRAGLRCRRPARGRDRARQARPGPDRRRAGDRDRRATSTTRSASSASSSRATPITLVNSVNPYRLEGQKTAAFEVVEELGGAPDWLALPVGNGGNITAYWMGFGESLRGERAAAAHARRPGRGRGAARAPGGRSRTPRRSRPRSGSATRPAGRGAGGASSESEGAVARGARRRRSWPPTGCLAQTRACSASRPRRHPWPACRGGADGLVEAGRAVVCVLTGHGLKDPDTAGAEGAEILRCPPHIERLERGRLRRRGEPVLA